MNQVPDSLLAFQRMFPDDDACAAWLIGMRWPDGFVCPACGHDKGWALRGKVYTFECAGCRRLRFREPVAPRLHGRLAAAFAGRPYLARLAGRSRPGTFPG